MRHSNASQKSWYTILLAIILTWFLLMLTTWGFHLVLQEMYDGRGKQNYLKAYAAAEAGLELALLQIKEKWYGYYEAQSFSDILWDDIKTAKVWYEFLSRSQDHSGTLPPFWIDIIPLFWINDNWEIHNISNNLTLKAEDSIWWNIIGFNAWVAWSGRFNSNAKQVNKKTLEETGSFLLTDSSLDAFLDINEEKYIFIINTDNTSNNYTLTTEWGNNYFTLPRHDIISSWKIWNYIQNIRTHVDNTEFIGLLRYSIYSWD